MFKLREFIKSFGERSRLRQKFLYYFFLAGIVPLILMGLAGVYLINRTHRIDVSTIELNLAKQQVAEIEKFIKDVTVLLDIRVGFKEFLQIAIPDQEFLLDGFFKANQNLIEASFICLTPDACEYGRETSKKSRFQKVFPEDLVNQTKNPKFLVAKEGRVYVGPAYFTLEGPMITIASPVKNASNQNIALVAAEISLREIQEGVSNIQLGDEGYLYITDKNGRIIAHSKNLGIGEPASHVKIVTDVVVGKKRTGLAAEDLYQSLWGERVIGSGQIVPSLSWGVIVEWPLTDAQAVVGKMLAQIGQFSLGTLFLVVVLATFVAWQLIQPISTLKEGARKIGEGKFDYRISLRTGDEIEELGHSLNKMAESLKQLEELHELKLKTQYLAEALAKEQELSKLKDQFISVASHQLYTPLSVIGWTLETLRDPKTPRDALVQGWQTINQSRQDLLDIASDLLTISEIGFRYEKTKSEIISLEEVTKTAMAKYRDRLDEKKLSLEIKAAKDTKVDAASFTIEKVIENLLSNAITYSNEGGKILIEISSSKNEVAFKIKDEGIGIPKEEQSSVFQAFFRAKNAVEKKNVGTGLGLFIVKTVIDGHKGKISFESEQNKGTTFTFVLPRK